jgi:chromosome segregation ATPase
MSNVNYHESIIIPTLQKKIQELQNSNLVLEVSLLIEQAKVKDAGNVFQSEIDSLKKCNQELEAKNARVTSLKTEVNSKMDELNSLRTQYNELDQKYNREVSVKNSILSEYNLLKVQCEESNKKIKELQDLLEDSKNQLSNAKADFEALKTSINTKKKQ